MTGFCSFVPRRSRSILVCILLVSCLSIYIRSGGNPGWRSASQPSAAGQGVFRTSGTRDRDRRIEQLRADKDDDDGEQADLPTISGVDPIPVIIFAFNRADNLRLTIDSLLAAVPTPTSLHPIFVSQDGDDAAVAEVIASYGSRVIHLHYYWPGKPPRKSEKIRTPYLKIAGHYQFALTHVMDHVNGHERWDRVVMLEDDMYVSPDFFSYFRRMSPLFELDSTLYCVSAWNDNGQSAFVSSSTALYRTECFPGLGWMLSRAIWTELREWAPGFWDDWMREPQQRKGRSCIYPEINRVYTFGREGVSQGKYFESWFEDIRLNTDNVDWNVVDVDHLLSPQYDEWLTRQLEEAVPLNSLDEARVAIDLELDNGADAATEISEGILEYKNLTHLTELTEVVGLVPDHKAGVPRTSYKGVLPFRYREVRLWLVPESFTLPLD